MKKYSSYKSIKPLNTSSIHTLNTNNQNHNSNTHKLPLSPTHSTSYRKLTTIDLSNVKPVEKHEVYPLSAKYANYVVMNQNNINTNNNYSTSNGLSTINNQNRKKMFSSKNINNHDHSSNPNNRPLTLNK
jgi:hypothetical protein